MIKRVGRTTQPSLLSVHFLGTSSHRMENHLDFIYKSRAGLIIALLALTLTACGGGESVAPAGLPTPTQTNNKLEQVAQAGKAAVARTPSATALMDWAQTAYVQYFPGRKGNVTLPPYLLRYYPETGNYLGVAGDSVYIYGPVSGNQLTQVGRLSDFSCSVYPESCLSSNADTRNGTYTAYATTGERFTLQLDFDQRQFFPSLSWFAQMFESRRFPTK